jgi:hypothetical protein
MNTTQFDRTAASALDSLASMGAWLSVKPADAHAIFVPDRYRRKTAALATALSLCVAWPVLAQTAGSASPAADVAAQASMNKRYADALQAYERNHWPQAYLAFTVLATQGHADAVRVVLLMHRYGPGLYGQDFALTASQRALLAPPSAGAPRVTVLHLE